MKNLKPIKLVPAREMVAIRLREAIMLRELKEGDLITLEGIASQLDVSITPVREAFQILEGELLIKRRPNKSALVLGISRKNLQDHYETRAVLESEAAAMAAKSGADISDIVELHQHTDKLLNEGVVEEYSNSNHAFHLGIWEAAGNDKIMAILTSLWNGLSMDVGITEMEYAKLSHREHTGILQAILDRDPEKARALMNEHIYRSYKNILTRFDVEEKKQNVEKEKNGQ